MAHKEYTILMAIPQDFKRSKKKQGFGCRNHSKRPDDDLFVLMTITFPVRKSVSVF